MDWEHGTPVMLGPWMLGLGEPSPETAPYWQGVADGRLLIKRCPGCAKHHHPRRMMCDDCSSDRMDWVQAAGMGTIYSYSVVHRAPSPEFQAQAPYTVGIVELDEGIFLFSRFYADGGGAVAIGARATVAFEEIASHGRLPVFYVGRAA